MAMHLILMLKMNANGIRDQNVSNKYQKNEIEPSNEYELKYNVLLHETRFSNDNQSDLPEFESKNEDEMAVYDFLEDVGDFYIDRFLQNGYTAMRFVLLMEKINLKEMNLKMGH